MFLTHKIRRRLCTMMIGALAICATNGCVTNQRNSKAEPGDTDLAINDEAMTNRVWERSHAEYQNMNTVAGPLGDPFHPTEEMNDGVRLGVEPALFVGNTLIMPGVFLFYPPWAQLKYRGDTYAPTYTGNGAAQLTGAIVTPATPDSVAGAAAEESPGVPTTYGSAPGK